MKQSEKQMSETFLTGILLAFSGGFLDAYTYLCRGGVFANAQTGNIVLLGISAAGGKWERALYYLVPISAFFLGILAAEWIKARFRDSRRIHWRQLIVAGEICILAAVAFMKSADTAANVLISFICALQVESFRKVNGNAFATTMCTGNLRSGTELLFRYFRTKDRELLKKSGQYFGIILSFIIGAGAGSILTNYLDFRSVLFACVTEAAVFFLMFQKTRENKIP